MNTVPFSKVCAQDVMQKEVVCLRHDTTLRAAWDLLSRHHISGAPVVDDEGNVVGVVSQHDLTRHVMNRAAPDASASAYYHGLPALSESFLPMGDTLHEIGEEALHTIMVPYVIAVRPTDPLPSVAATMRSHHIHRVIVTEGKKVVGIVSTFDLLGLVQQDT